MIVILNHFIRMNGWIDERQCMEQFKGEQEKRENVKCWNWLKPNSENPFIRIGNFFFRKKGFQHFFLFQNISFPFYPLLPPTHSNFLSHILNVRFLLHNNCSVHQHINIMLWPLALNVSRDIVLRTRFYNAVWDPTWILHLMLAFQCVQFQCKS